MPDFPTKLDEVHNSLTSIGTSSAVAAIGSDLLFEMGNCFGDKAPKIASARTRFYSAKITLKETGLQIAGVESAGMIGYVELMRGIPADQRPYKANRDVKKNEGAGTPREFAQIFSATPHSQFSSGGATSLNSGDTYALETITLAKDQDLKDAVSNLGAKHLSLTTQQGRKAWDDIVTAIAAKMTFTNQTAKSSFYQVCTGILHTLQTSGTVRGMSVTDNILTGVSAPTPVQIPFNQLKSLLGSLIQAAAGPAPVVLRDDQIRSRAREAHIQAV